jgi:predicted lactoylglutathione lyase
LIAAPSRGKHDALSGIAPVVRCSIGGNSPIMIKQISLSLPVADLSRSVAFFKALGFALNPQCTGDTAAMVVLGETVSVMLMTQAKFREFTPKAVCDTSQAVEALFCLYCESRQEVDDLVAKALAAGGSTYDKPEDFGFMYTHSFLDPDGHGWGLVHMSASPQG